MKWDVEEKLWWMGSLSSINRTVKKCDLTQQYICSTIVKPPVQAARLCCNEVDLEVHMVGRMGETASPTDMWEVQTNA